jgi:hypothetical protein
MVIQIGVRGGEGGEWITYDTASYRVIKVSVYALGSPYLAREKV